MAVSQWKGDSLNKGRVVSWHRPLYFIIKKPKWRTSVEPRTDVAACYELSDVCWALQIAEMQRNNLYLEIVI